jgi:hypothetical protein
MRWVINRRKVGMTSSQHGPADSEFRNCQNSRLGTTELKAATD